MNQSLQVNFGYGRGEHFELEIKPQKKKEEKVNYAYQIAKDDTYITHDLEKLDFEHNTFIKIF